METFFPLLDRLGLPLGFLAIALIAFVRGDIVPKYLYTQVLADLDRERRETDRFLDMSIRLLEDARDGQHLGREALRAFHVFREQRNRDEDVRNDDEGQEREAREAREAPPRTSILDRRAREGEGSEGPDAPNRQGRPERRRER